MVSKRQEVPPPEPIPSKDLPPFSKSFASIFFNNQFQTTIALPTAEAFPDIKGKCAVITGSNTGLGLEASRHLLSLGLSHLVMGVRSLEKGKTAALDLRSVNPSAKIDVWELDMESYDSIQCFARRCDESLSRIDAVILNAGLSAPSFKTTPATGHEQTIQVNHYSTMLLAILLLPVLKTKSESNGPGGSPPRVTFVNSITAHICKVPNKDQRPFLASFDDLSVTPWTAEGRYGASKLLCQLMVVRLAEHVKASDIILNMVDPGLTKGTGLTRDATGAVRLVSKALASAAGRDVVRGAATYVDAAFGHGEESHGCFLMNCKISPLSGWYYTDGEHLSEAVWNETMTELGFAGVKEIVPSM